MPVDGALIDGGSYQLREHSGAAIPVFAFHTADLARTQAVLKDMYVELDVRFNQAGRLAYHLGVPDRQLAPVAIPIDEHDLPRIIAGAALLNTCVTVMRGGAGPHVVVGPVHVRNILAREPGDLHVIRA